MRAIFVHDHNFVFDSNKRLYFDGSGGAFDSNLWRRYLEVFDNITVIGREIKELPNKLIISSTHKVAFNLISGAHGIRSILKNRKTIKKELEKLISNTDFIIIRLPSLLGKWAFEIVEKSDKKYVIEIVGDPFEAYWYHGSLKGKLLAPIECLALKSITSKATNVIYVTKNALQERYPNTNNNCAISNVRLQNVIHIDKVIDFYSIQKNTLRLGLIGTFHVKYKGHYEALKAVSHLKKIGYNNIELYLVGTGDSDWINKIVEKLDIFDHVKILGALDAGEKGIFPFLDNIDIYIHPSKTEGLPRVILEAMSRGKICLASNVGGTSELLPKDFMHKPGDWENLAKQVEYIATLNLEQKIDIARANLRVATEYKESILQQKRVKFLQGCF